MVLQLVTPVLQDDSALIAACIRGEASAQRTLFKREYQRVFKTVARLMGSNRDVDDLVQETFVSVFRALGSFRGEAKLSTWIDRIAVRAVFHHLRAKKRTVSLDVVGELEDGTAGVEDKAQAREGLRRLYAVRRASSVRALCDRRPHDSRGRGAHGHDEDRREASHLASAPRGVPTS